MRDTHPDTASQNQNDWLHFAQEAVRQAPECRESRITAAQRALNEHDLMLHAEVLASRIMTDPLHQVHCDG